MTPAKTVRRSARHAEGDAGLGSMISHVASAPTPTAPATSTTASITPPAPVKTGTYFRFLDLPAELRNHTYAFAFSSDHSEARSLSDLKFPGITQVNQQLRQESLAFLFAESSFFLYVGSNLHVRANVRHNLKPRDGTTKEYNSMSGTLGYKRVVQQFLKSAGESAILRDVTFKMYDSSDIEEVRNADRPRNGWLSGYRQNTRDNCCNGVLRLTFNQSLNISIEVLNGPLRVNHSQDIRSALHDAVDVSSAIAERPQFKGFTLSDLAKIARAFRYE